MTRFFQMVIFALASVVSLSGQDIIFKVEVTADTLYYGNTIGLKYTIQNTQGDFEPPDFTGFELVGGPNVSSQFSMINGTVTQSSSYEYFLVPVMEGNHFISPASLTQGEDIMYSDSLKITVVPNPEGIIQDYRTYDVAKDIAIHKPKQKLSKQDSLRMKLKKVKSTKI